MNPDRSVVTDRRHMCWVPPGTFVMGADEHYPEEAPAHEVAVDGFWMDEAPITNRAFEGFVAETDYRTLAERLANEGSAVFRTTPAPVPLTDPSAWWAYVPGADWRHPEGPDSTLAGREDHPVRHVADGDAVAYAEHFGLSLPTEAQWEYAAWGGAEKATYAWGDDFAPGGVRMANTWCGEFPWRSEKALPPGTEPIATYPANGYGLYDMMGQVWEWTSDWYQPSHANMLGLNLHASCCVPRNPSGPSTPMHDPANPSEPLRVLKGGSYLCASNYCSRYRPPARIGQAVNATASNIGFRCVKNP